MRSRRTGERGLEILDDLLRDDFWRREVVHVLEELVAEPCDVETDLVALEEFVVGEPFEALALLALLSRSRLVGGDEFVQALAPQWVLLQREVLVRTEVVDP